jgi:hypothetical protein
MGCEDLVKLFFHMNLNIKLYHWQTKSYARHKATCELHGVLSDLSDKFIEVYMGRYQRPEFKEPFTVMVKELSDNKTAKELIEEYITVLKKEVVKYIKSTDTDLTNIRDEMLAELNKTLYLFTLE